MKKIFFAGLMLLALGGVMNAQTPSTTNQKKTVSSVTPANTTKSKAVTKTTAKPAATSSATKPAITTSAIGKHKKARKAAKKHK